MNIPRAAIEAARAKGACVESLDWLEAEPRTVTKLVAKSHVWAEWAASVLGSGPALKAYKVAKAHALEACVVAKSPEWKAYVAAKAHALTVALEAICERYTEGGNK